MLSLSSFQPRVAIVLGSGLGNVPESFQALQTISFADVPGIGQTSVHGHAGEISLGLCGEIPLLLFRGRLHFYEGHPWGKVSRPVEYAASLGIRFILLTNAAGGIRDSLNPGSLLLIRDIVDWQRPASWAEESSSHEPDAWCPRFIDLCQKSEAGRGLESGVYAAVTGPCYETPAEIRALRSAGADAVGMSTAHEARTARSLGLRVGGISCITNRAAGLSSEVLDHNDVLKIAGQQTGRLSAILEAVLPDLHAELK